MLLEPGDEQHPANLKRVMQTCRFGKRLHLILGGTVDGRNPKQPPGMYKTPVNNGINYLSTGAGFLPSTVSTHMSPYMSNENLTVRL